MLSKTDFQVVFNVFQDAIFFGIGIKSFLYLSALGSVESFFLYHLDQMFICRKIRSPFKMAPGGSVLPEA